MKSKKLAAVVAAVALGLGGAVFAVAAPASAHVPSISTTCDGVSLNATAYDGSKQNDWTVTIGGVTQSGHFGATFSQSFPVPQAGATTAWSATIQAYDGTYKDTESGNVGPCGTAPKVPLTVTINPVVVHPATCTAPVTYDVPSQPEVLKYDLKTDGTRPTVGNGQVLSSGEITIAAHVAAQYLVANGGDYAAASYSKTITGGPATGYQSTNSDAPCYQAPPPGATVCTAGAIYHESDDNAAVKTADGYQFTNQGDGKPVDLLINVNTNAQDITGIQYTDKNVVGNGIFFRFIFDLSADGGPSYASFSVSGTNTIDQSSVAGVGSKNVLLGKTVAQVAADYPHNKITAIAWQTGSAYAAGDGALLTGYSGVCGSASFVDQPTPPTHPTKPTTPTAPNGINTGDVSPLAQWAPATGLAAVAALLLGVFLLRRRTVTGK